MDNYPVFSAGDYIFNPYDQLYAAFHSKTLMSYKADLDKWIRFACSSDKVWSEKPDVLVALFKDVCIITECCWAVHVQGPNYPENWDHTIAGYTRKRAKEPDADYKYKLPESMIAHPENYLKDFFNNHTVNDIFDILFECLYTAFGHEEPYPYSFDEITNVAGECTCLLEAAYLIQKKKYPGRD